MAEDSEPRTAQAATEPDTAAGNRGEPEGGWDTPLCGLDEFAPCVGVPPPSLGRRLCFLARAVPTRVVDGACVFGPIEERCLIQEITSADIDFGYPCSGGKLVWVTNSNTGLSDYFVVMHEGEEGWIYLVEDSNLRIGMSIATPGWGICPVDDSDRPAACNCVCDPGFPR